MSGDLFPYVVGRVKAGSLEAVRLERESASGSDEHWQTPDEKVDTDGSFVVQVELTRARDEPLPPWSVMRKNGAESRADGAVAA